MNRSTGSAGNNNNNNDGFVSPPPATGRCRWRHGCRRTAAACNPQLPQGADFTAHGSGAMPLSALPPGRKARLYCINAGRSLCGRLTSMGLAPGMLIEVIRRQSRCEMVICAHRTRLALGRGIIEKILVLPVPPDEKAGSENNADADHSAGFTPGEAAGR